MSIVICSLNGADGVRRCLEEVAAQTIADELEVILVDDGSTDGTAGVGRDAGVRVIRHEHNRGIAAARTTGALAATAPIIGYLDDDCVPEPTWAERVLTIYDEGDDVVGANGIIVPVGGSGYLGRYLERHNPLLPLEKELGASEALPYRLWLYLGRQWRGREPEGPRELHALVGANMSFRRQALLDAGAFDGRFSFGAEELDVCRRVMLAHPEGRFVLEPSARISHHFTPTLRDILRRSRAYGIGSARFYRKWPTSRPTFFPYPGLMGLLLALSMRRPRLLALVPVLLGAMYPAGLRHAVRERAPEALADPTVRLAQEAAENVGFLTGLWRFRDFTGEDEVPRAASAEPLKEAA